MTNDEKNRQFLLYTAPDGAVRVEVVYQDETVWLTQKRRTPKGGNYFHFGNRACLH